MTDPLALLQPFIEQSRWFGGKGRPFTISGVRRLGEVPGHVPDGPRVAIDLATVSYEDAGEEKRRCPGLAQHGHQVEMFHHLNRIFVKEA